MAEVTVLTKEKCEDFAKFLIISVPYKYFETIIPISTKLNPEFKDYLGSGTTASFLNFVHKCPRRIDLDGLFMEHSMMGESINREAFDLVVNEFEPDTIQFMVYTASKNIDQALAIELKKMLSTRLNVFGLKSKDGHDIQALTQKDISDIMEQLKVK